MAKTKQEKIYALLDTIEECKDRIIYEKLFDKFSRVVSSKKQALVNYDTEEGQFITIFKSFRRAIINAGISSVLSSIPMQKIFRKGLSYDQYAAWKKDLDSKIPQIQRDFQNKMIVPITASYGKGFNKGVSDMGLKPTESWMYLPGHAVPRLTNLRLVNYISNKLTIDMTAVIVDGMRAGRNGNDIARDLRKLTIAPKHVVVKPKLDLRTGEVLRRGYEYDIPIKRYTEIIGRTEVNRATNMGRLDSYQRSGLVKSVIFIAAGDNRVCAQCSSLVGTVVPLSQSFAMIPVHMMCRCTWEAHSYYADADKKVASENFVVDSAEKAENTSPVMNIVQGKKATLDAMARYKKHLANHGFDNATGHGKIYSKLKKQLKALGVEGFEGWKFGQFDNIYALHTFKNARYALQRGLKTPLPKINTLKYQKVINKDKNMLGQATHYTKTGENIIEISDAGIYEHLFHTSVHEQGHTIFPTLTGSNSKMWDQLYRSSKANAFISHYAKTNAMEDFCETMTSMVLNPDKLRRISDAKYSFMQDKMFETPKKNPISSTSRVWKWGRPISKNDMLTEAQLMDSPEGQKAIKNLQHRLAAKMPVESDWEDFKLQFYKDAGSNVTTTEVTMDQWLLNSNRGQALWIKRSMATSQSSRDLLAKELRRLRQDLYFDKRKYFSFTQAANRDLLTEKLFTSQYYKHVDRKTIDLLRGVTGKMGEKLATKVGKEISFQVNTASSWTLDKRAADFFASRNGKGAILKKRIETSNFFATVDTNSRLRGGLEQEFIFSPKGTSSQTAKVL